MTTIGVDLHKFQLNTVVLDEHGAIQQRRELPTKCRNQIREYFASFGPHCQVAKQGRGSVRQITPLLLGGLCRSVLGMERLPGSQMGSVSFLFDIIAGKKHLTPASIEA